MNDQIGAYLVADTLRRLRQDPGLGSAGALRNAELGLLQDAGTRLPAQIAQPFYWAPFAAIGEGEGRASPRTVAGL